MKKLIKKYNFDPPLVSAIYAAIIFAFFATSASAQILNEKGFKLVGNWLEAGEGQCSKRGRPLSGNGITFTSIQVQRSFSLNSAPADYFQGNVLTYEYGCKGPTISKGPIYVCDPSGYSNIS